MVRVQTYCCKHAFAKFLQSDDIMYVPSLVIINLTNRVPLVIAVAHTALVVQRLNVKEPKNLRPFKHQLNAISTYSI
jgi:hypothetical protein